MAFCQPQADLFNTEAFAAFSPLICEEKCRTSWPLWNHKSPLPLPIPFLFNNNKKVNSFPILLSAF